MILLTPDAVSKIAELNANNGFGGDIVTPATIGDSQYLCIGILEYDILIPILEKCDIVEIEI